MATGSQAFAETQQVEKDKSWANYRNTGSAPQSPLYQDLGPSEIRLIRIKSLLPGAIIELEMVHASLDHDRCTRQDVRHSDLENGPRYLALSYVWGDETDTMTVSINSHEVQITRNLCEALVRYLLVETCMDGSRIYTGEESEAIFLQRRLIDCP